MKQKGFSLIELLIVVAVIGILAAIAIPAYLGQQTKAKRHAAMENIQALSAAMEIYYQEHNNYGPDGTISGSAVKDRYKSFKPQTNYDFSVNINNSGQSYVITCESDDFGSYSKVTLDNNGTMQWVE
jgi:type II secretion system protein G